MFLLYFDFRHDYYVLGMHLLSFLGCYIFLDKDIYYVWMFEQDYLVYEFMTLFLYTFQV